MISVKAYVKTEADQNATPVRERAVERKLEMVNEV